MSGWELFTWINVWLLAAGSIIVLVLFLRQLPRSLRGRKYAYYEYSYRADSWPAEAFAARRA